MTNFYCKLILFVAVFILIVNHGNTQCPPDLVGLSNQAQVDQFVQDWPNCTHLNASLHLNSAELNDISKLSNIVSINGQLSVSNTNLQELSLPNLEYMLWGVTSWRRRFQYFRM